MSDDRTDEQNDERLSDLLQSSNSAVSAVYRLIYS